MKKNKKAFISPEITLYSSFDANDIITTSGGVTGLSLGTAQDFSEMTDGSPDFSFWQG